MWAIRVMSGVLVENLARKFSWVAFVLEVWCAGNLSFGATHHYLGFNKLGCWCAGNLGFGAAQHYPGFNKLECGVQEIWVLGYIPLPWF